MKTIVEPKQSIVKLWGKQRVRADQTYRLMKYIFRVDHAGKVLLHNVVTGQLVVLEQEENEVVTILPQKYKPVMEQLVNEYYLVPKMYDERQQIANLQIVLRRLSDLQKANTITKYTILPTTTCNARCYYCFEHGVKPLTMSELTANDVVQFIVNHCGEKKSIHLSWFGGEPTMAPHRIDQICKGLQEKHIQYWSDMNTNGYLFDEDMVSKAKSLWHLESVMICLDGTEKHYNKTKAFVNAKENPYYRVMRNIGLFLEYGMHVSLRMNFDVLNYKDFYDLIEEVTCRYKRSSLLKLHAHPVVGEYKDYEGLVRHGTDEWFSAKVVELNDAARKADLLKDDDYLPSLQIGCQAASDSSITINANGLLAKCPEQFGVNDAVGDLIHGVINTQLLQAWKEFCNSSLCIECAMYPACAKISKCSARERCNFRIEIHRAVERTICHCYDEWEK